MKGIRSADICLADISLPKPNVWFEVGFAIASGKDPVLICKDDVERFPFDVQHRSIIKYKTDSQTDFQNLASKITKKIVAYLKTKTDLAEISDLSPLVPVHGLSEYERAALVTVAQDFDPIASFHFQRQMDQAGYTPIAAKLAMEGLRTKEMIELGEQEDDHGRPYFGMKATAKGLAWLTANQHMLVLKHGQKEIPDDPPPGRSEEDIPF